MTLGNCVYCTHSGVNHGVLVPHWCEERDSDAPFGLCECAGFKGNQEALSEFWEEFNG